KTEFPVPRVSPHICAPPGQEAPTCAASRATPLLIHGLTQPPASHLFPLFRREIPILTATCPSAVAAQSAAAGHFAQSPPPPRFPSRREPLSALRLCVIFLYPQLNSAL